MGTSIKENIISLTQSSNPLTHNHKITQFGPTLTQKEDTLFQAQPTST